MDTRNTPPGSPGARISFIVPPSVQVPTPGREYLLKGPFEGITSLSSLLSRSGYDVDIIDCRNADDPVALALNSVSKSSRIVGIATYADSFTFLERCTAALKARRPDVVIVLGGPLVTSAPALVMENVNADIAVLGEAELTLKELVESLHAGNDIRQVAGICFKDAGGAMVFTPPREQIRDLDSLPLPDYSLWPQVRNNPTIKELSFSTSRGCYKNCSFCYRTIRDFSTKSPERFKRELVALKETHGTEYVFLNDLTFTHSKDRIRSVCDVFKKTGIRWSCMFRVDELTRELMEQIKDSNCVSIWVGIESVDQDVLDRCHKDITPEQVRRTIAAANDLRLEMRGLFIIGLPGETEASLESMLAFIKKEKIIPLVKYLTPFPGTDVYRTALETKIIDDEVDYLRWMSRRKVAAIDDRIINLTALPERTLRDAFRRFWDVTTERTGYRPAGV